MNMNETSSIGGWLDGYTSLRGDISQETHLAFLEPLNEHGLMFPKQPLNQVFGLSAFYIISVFALNSLALKTEKLKPVIAIYNFIMSAWSFYMFYEFAAAIWNNFVSSGYDMSLLTVDNDLVLSQNTQKVFMMFIWSKYIEYLDTYWMIFRGKLGLNPRCFLQVYHHFVTPAIVYLSLFYPFGHSWVGPLTNSFVHVNMYFYYGCSYFFSGNKTFRKFGNPIFYTQMTQFFLCVVVGVLDLYHAGHTNSFSIQYCISQYFVFVGLFTLFFMQRQKEMKGKKKVNWESIQGIFFYFWVLCNFFFSFNFVCFHLSCTMCR